MAKAVAIASLLSLLDATAIRILLVEIGSVTDKVLFEEFVLTVPHC